MSEVTLLWRAMLAAAIAPALACGQFISMYGPQSSLVDTSLANMRYWMNQTSLMVTHARAYQAQQRAQQAARAGQQAPPPAPVRRPPGNFVFPYQGRLLSMEELAAAITSDAASRRQVAGELAELVQTVAGELKGEGPPYDLSKAFTLFTATMYSVFNPGAPITERTMDRLRMQFRCELLEESGMRNPPETLQKQWEMLLAISGWTLMAYESAVQKQNHSLAASLRQTAGKALQKVFGMDPMQLRIDAGADWPLSASAEPPPASGAGWGQPAVSPAPAPGTPQGWGGQEPARALGQAANVQPPLAAGGGVRVGHHHFLTGMHPALLVMGDAELTFDPQGHGCNQPRLSAPYPSVQVRDPAYNGNGELLMNVRMPDPRNPKKTVNLNFASEDSWIDESSGAPVVRSPASAMERLQQLAAELRRRGAK